MSRHLMIERTLTTVVAALVAVVALGPLAHHGTAYERYSDGCYLCHGDFFDGTSPKGSIIPAGSKHEMHKGAGLIEAACMLCHGGPGFEADYLAQSGGTEVNPGVGCVGCHGRAYDGIGDSGVGLRLVHGALCTGCHSGDPAPLPESVSPTYYGTIDTSVYAPCNLPFDYNENHTLGDVLGLDNDGDGIYDAEDDDCGLDEFPTSLHATRPGKNFWYGTENGGFESFTGVPIDELGCAGCHGPTDANGNPYPDPYQPDCVDCHATLSGWSVDQNQCLSCHSRQKTEMMTLGYSDVHRDVGLVCWDCHTVGDMHGDGMVYDSMLQDGAIDADCDECHETLPAAHVAYDPHNGNLHCTACHAQTVITCYNCHFESQVQAHVKRAKQPLHDFVMLVNREEDGKVYTASFQSLTYQGDAFVAFAPFTSHTITREGRVCTECHVNMGGENEAIEQYNDTGEIRFAQWDDDTKTLSWIHGVVPIPADYETTLKMDFLTYTGDPSDPPPGDPLLWTGTGQDTWDGHQMFFATPLTEFQMAALGFEGTGGFGGLHWTRTGKNFWYGAENGGFETFTGVPMDELGCVQCHGPTDANGNPYAEPYTPDCVDCHATASGWTTDQDQCLSCHSRQKAEIQPLGYSDVHRDAGFVCWDCHTVGDMHGDGTDYESMLEPGAIDADCEYCHDMPPSHDGPHDGALHCTACHAQTVISCYNCHFESQVQAHVKRAKQQLHDFVILVNREEDGKVYTASFQSLTYQGNAFAAIAPFTSHSITAEGRVCGDCHYDMMGGYNEAIEQYNETGQIRFTQWDEDTKTLSWIHGVVPLPADYQTTFKMDFLTYIGDPSDPPPGDPLLWTGIGKDTWDGHQLFFASPMTLEQMEVLGFELPEPCPEDVNGDSVVDVLDLLAVIAAWGTSGGPEDINGDGTVDVLDLLAVIAAWGPC